MGENDVSGRRGGRETIPKTRRVREDLKYIAKPHGLQPVGPYGQYGHLDFRQLLDFTHIILRACGSSPKLLIPEISSFQPGSSI